MKDATEEIADVAGLVAHAISAFGPRRIEWRDDGGMYEVFTPPHVVGGIVDGTTVRFAILSEAGAVGPNVRGYAAEIARMYLPDTIGVSVTSKGRG